MILGIQGGPPWPTSPLRPSFISPFPSLPIMPQHTARTMPCSARLITPSSKVRRSLTDFLLVANPCTNINTRAPGARSPSFHPPQYQHTSHSHTYTRIYTSHSAYSSFPLLPHTSIHRQLPPQILLASLRQAFFPSHTMAIICDQVNMSTQNLPPCPGPPPTRPLPPVPSK